jgi:mannose-6-phosphate isomerase
LVREPIFLQPLFKERIWGGTALREEFGYAIPSDTTGECWAISAHPHGQSVVREGKFKGLTLGELWEFHRYLFGRAKGERFPLLTKILDANEDLSVQVHPDDAYARQYANGDLGKTECWYIIDCKEGAEIVYGHHAQNRQHLEEMIQHGEWDRLLKKVAVKPGDFFYVPSGTLHALGSGILVLETQQSSDTTYRVYDYERRDANGNLRELHLEQAIQVTTVPHVDPAIRPRVTVMEGAKITTFVENEFFTVQKCELAGETVFEHEQDFLLVSVLKGEGELLSGQQSYRFQKGDHFILPSTFGTYRLKGNAECIFSHP